MKKALGFGILFLGILSGGFYLWREYKFEQERTGLGGQVRTFVAHNQIVLAKLAYDIGASYMSEAQAINFGRELREIASPIHNERQKATHGAAFIKKIEEALHTRERWAKKEGYEFYIGPLDQYETMERVVTIKVISRDLESFWLLSNIIKSRERLNYISASLERWKNRIEQFRYWIK